MTTEKFDVIVIGAGLGGLSTAGYIAKAGKKVLVLENHTVPGGYAHEFRRGKYRFEAALHALDGAGPGGWAYPTLADLEVLKQVHFHRMDPFYTVQYGEREVTAHADLVKYEEELIRHFPEEADSIRSMINAMMQVFFEVRRFMADGELDRRPPMVEMPNHFPNLLKAMTQSWDDFMDEYIQDAELKGVFSTIWPYYGLPPTQLNAATFIFPWVSYHLFGAYYPEGGSMAMSRALEKTIKKYGGEVRYRQRVNGIEIEDGMATAVTTEKGLRFEADLIISNANAPDTMLKFVGREHLPRDYMAKIEDALDKPSVASVSVYLGLERDLMAEGWPHHELFITDGKDPDADYEAVMNGRFEDASMCISHYDQADPGCAPAGGSVLAIIALAPWDYADQWGTGGNLENYSKNPHYQELKMAAGEALLERAEKIIPGLRDSVKYMEVATPLTNYRYSLNPKGSIYGSEQSVDNMYFGRLGTNTPIPNLFMTGAWVFAGGMSAALLSGRNVARKANAFLEGETVNDLVALDSLSLDSVAPPIPALRLEEPAAPETTTKSSQPTISTASVPDVTLTAASSRRKVTLSATGLPTVLLFHTQETAVVANKVNQAVRERYPLASQVLVASVVDLHGVPKLFRKFAEGAMRKSYQQAAGELPKGAKAEDYVVILQDWNGKTTAEFGLKDVDKTAAVIVLDAQGQVAGQYQDDNLAKTAIKMLANVMGN